MASGDDVTAVVIGIANGSVLLTRVCQRYQFYKNLFAHSAGMTPFNKPEATSAQPGAAAPPTTPDPTMSEENQSLDMLTLYRSATTDRSSFACTSLHGDLLHEGIST
jgi:hypothetical protein